ncbi:IclR family transcriptional regulator [Rhodococcus sp. NPDC057529]|uniref:IclR family transcriptional regulator n=1 Tax=Rhodococcus sp. NPDC057529 TaxID=3346158 RepID=UPI00367238D1
MTEDSPNDSARPPGTQTLARGLTALQTVAASDGLSVQQIADELQVHRTVAYRLLMTLNQFGLVSRGEDGQYRSGAGLVALGNSFDRHVRSISLPILRGLADELGATVSLLVAEGDEAVAIAVIVPTAVSYHLSFLEGSRTPLDRGAAGVVLSATLPPRPDERQEITEARTAGWATSFGEIEPDTYGLAVPIRRPQPGPPTCINLITHRADVIERSRDAVIKAAERVSAAIR